VLSEAGCALTHSAIETAASTLIHKMGRVAAKEAGLVDVNEKTIRARVRLLEKYSLVSKPFGDDGKPAERKGVGITNMGRALIRNNS
jgi:hypothetical protein